MPSCQRYCLQCISPFVCNTKKTNSRDICNFVSRIVRLIGKSWGYWICNKSLSSVTCIMLWFKFILGLHFISQGARKVIFTACYSGKLKLAFTSPNIISTWTPKIFWWAELILKFFCKLNSSTYFTCLSGKLRTEFTSSMAKSTSPRLSDTTFFARSFPLFFTRFYLQMVFTVTSSNCKVKIARFYNRLTINKK